MGTQIAGEFGGVWFLVFFALFGSEKWHVSMKQR
jgi:hypothetical protein